MSPASHPTATADLDRFFGALYLETSADLMTPRLAAMEAEVLVSLLAPRRGGLYLDLGCGHGRHVVALAERGVSGVVGLDRSAPYVALGRAARPDLPWVRGDYRALPIRDGGLAGAYAWYSGLFLFDDATNRRVLEEVRRALEPGGRLVHDGANPVRLAADPVATYSRRTAAGDRVEEICRFDPETGVETGRRRLVRRGGEVLEGGWSARHYDADGLTALLTSAGFEVESLRDERGRPYEPDRALDLVAVARRPVHEQPEESPP